MLLFIQSNRESTESTKQNINTKKQKAGLTIFEMSLFAMFGALMFSSKILMEFLPNIHLIGMFTILFTVVYRYKALIPIYIFVFLSGAFYGFNVWWVPYLYIWTVLWAVAMLIPRNISPKWMLIIYPLICSLHGFLYGILYAPAQAIMFGLDFRETIAWIISGVPFDVIHGISNLIAGLLIYPLSLLLRKLTKYNYRNTK